MLIVNRPAVSPAAALRLVTAGLLAMLMAAVLLPGNGLAQEPEVSTEDVPVAGETDGTSRRVVVRFLTEGDFPPFNFYDEDGSLVGFNVDLARAICSELNTACDIKVRPWGELLLALRRGDADAVIASHAVTPQALSEVDFTDPYFKMPGRFAGPKTEQAAEINPETLESKRIGVARNSPHEAFVRTFFRSSAVRPFENADLARDALLQGQVDYLFDDAVSLVFWLHGTASKRCCELKGGPYLEPKYFGDGMAIAVPKADAQIKAMLNGALARLRADGRLEEITERYFPVKIF